MATKKRKFPYLWLSIIMPICVFSCGAFSISNVNHQKREISKQISEYEIKIKSITRTNDELTLKIAEQKNPMRLMQRASSKLIQPNIMENIVWAYENFEGGRVVHTYKKSNNTMSFKVPTKNK